MRNVLFSLNGPTVNELISASKGLGIQVHTYGLKTKQNYNEHDCFFEFFPTSSCFEHRPSLVVATVCPRSNCDVWFTLTDVNQDCLNNGYFDSVFAAVGYL